MTTLFKNPSELKFNRNVRVLIYGSPGIGKSTLALSAPKPVLFDFDGGVHRVNGAHLCPTLQVESYDQVLEALNEDLSQFETIIIDTAGKMLDYMTEYIIRKNPKAANYDGSLTLKGYGTRKVMFIDFLNKVSMMNKHIVFVAYEREDKNGDVKFVRPEIGGSSAGDLIKELDLVGYVKAVGRDRTIFWNPQEEFYAKNSCNLPDAHKIPIIIDEKGNVTGKNEFLTNVFNSRSEYMSQQEDCRKKYDNLVAECEDLVNGVKDVDTANSVRDKLASMTHIWDSKLRCGLLLNNKCASLGLRYNKATEKYEQAS